MRLRNDQVHVQAQVDRAQAKNQYTNMKSKSKVRKLFDDTNMSPPIVVDFKNQIKEGTFYICIICNHCLYNISVILFKKANYGDASATLTSLVKLYDDILYICKPCDKAVKEIYSMPSSFK